MKDIGNLVLSRKEGESIVIGGAIEVTLINIDCNRVKIAIKCDKEIRIQRGEHIGVAK